MAAHFDYDDDDLWELAKSYVDLLPPGCLASPNEVKFSTQFRDSIVL